MGVELARIPAGADLELEVELAGVSEGVLVTGTVTGPLVGECARCLEPFTSATKVQFQELYVPAGNGGRAGQAGHVRQAGQVVQGRQSSADEQLDVDSYVLDGNGLLDLEPALRDAIVLELPLSPLCSDGCQGLCVECGVRLADAGPGHKHEQRGAMWEALKDYRAGEPEGAEPPGEPREDETPDRTARPDNTTHRTDAAPGQPKEH
jgi:uncharacterized protein